jgi:iron(III) transport system permease protein
LENQVRGANSISLGTSEPMGAEKRDIPVARALAALPVILIGLLALAPVLIAVVGSFRISLPGEPALYGIQGWITAFSTPTIWDAVANTFILALMRVPLAVALGAVMAWLLIRTNLPGRATFEFLFWIAFFLPSLPMAMAWVLLLDPHSGWVNLALQHWLGLADPVFDIFTYVGITWVHLTVSTVPVMIILLGPAFRALDPALEESALMSGASHVACLRRIVLPLVAPAMITAAIASLIRSLEAFEIELYIGIPAGIRVYSTKIYELAVWEPPQYASSMAMSVPFVCLLFALALIYQRFLQRRRDGLATVTGKRAAASLIDLGGWRVLWTIVFGVAVALAVVVPSIALVLGSFMTLFGVASADGESLRLTTRHWTTVLNDNLFLDSVWNTAAIGAGAAIGGILAFSMIAYLIIRSRVPGRGILDILVWLPWAIPGILLSLSLLWIYLGSPVLTFLYGSFLGLVFAMIFKEMPIGVNLMKTGLVQIGADLEEAAQMAGANWWQIYWRVFFPLLLPTALAIGVIVFIACVKDISTMILLSTPETRPMSLLMLEYLTGGSIERGVVIGVIATGLTVVVALVARHFSRALGA